MKIKYESVTGEITEVEVSEEIGAVIIASRKDEHAQDERHRYHCYSYDAIEYEGREYADDHTPESDLMAEHETATSEHLLRKGMNSLTETERKRFVLFSQGLTYRQIAKIEGLRSHNAVAKSIDSARKKFLKIFED